MVGTGVLLQLVDQPQVVFDDLEHADLFLQGPSAEFMTDSQVGLAGLVQISAQCRCVFDVIGAGSGHGGKPRSRAVRRRSSSVSLLLWARIRSAMSVADTAKSTLSR